jgi:hypothetical protein
VTVLADDGTMAVGEPSVLQLFADAAALLTESQFQQPPTVHLATYRERPEQLAWMVPVDTVEEDLMRLTVTNTLAKDSVHGGGYQGNSSGNRGGYQGRQGEGSGGNGEQRRLHNESGPGVGYNRVSVPQPSGGSGRESPYMPPSRQQPTTPPAVTSGGGSSMRQMSSGQRDLLSSCRGTR